MTPQDGAGAFSGIGAVSSLFGGISKYEQGQSEKSAYDYNAQITLQNMQAQMVASQQKYSSLVGKQASSYAASGVDIASGSPLLVMAATAARGAQQGEQIKQAGPEEANLQQYYGRLSAWEGTTSGISSFLSGMSTTAMQYGKATGAFDS